MSAMESSAATIIPSAQPEPVLEPELPKPPGRIGSLLAEIGDLVGFSARALAATPASPRYFSEAFRQLAILIKGSLLIISFMTFLIGVATSLFGIYFLRSAGASDYAGLFTGIAVPRQAVVLMFGYIFAAKVGCGLVAAIGSMRISDELDAYEIEGVDPMRFIVGTRILATAAFGPIAAVVGLAMCNLGAYLNVVFFVGDVSSAGFSRLNWGLQTVQDQVFSLLMMTAVGVTIILVACFYGYRASGGPAGVGRAVARSMVVNLVLVHVIISLLTSLIYGSDPRLPIGG